MAAAAARVEPRGNLPPIACSERESLELIGCASAAGQDFQTWAKDVLQAAARRSGVTVQLELNANEQAAVQATARKFGISLSAFTRRALLAAVRRVGSMG